MKRFVFVSVAMALVVASCTSSDPTAATTVTSSVETTTTSTSVSPPVADTTTTTVSRFVTTTTAIPPTTTTTIPITPRTPPKGWTEVAIDPELFGDATLTAGVVSDGRFVLVGCEREVEHAATATLGFPVWVSDDGTEWKLADGPDGVGCLKQVEATPFGYFAVTRGGGGDALYSEDGLVWERLELRKVFGFDEQFELGPALAVLVSPNRDRVTLLYSRAAEGESRFATLVTTTDGETWTEGPASSAALFDSSDFAAVIEGGPGLIAVGTSPGGEFVPTAAVFTSPDGLHWTRVTPRNADFNDKTLRDVLAFDDGYVAVGGDYEDIRLMTAWTSLDGTHWHRSPSPAGEVAVTYGFMVADVLTSFEGSIWATGFDFDAARGNDNNNGTLPALWRSDNGVNWLRVDPEIVTVPFVVIDSRELRIGVWPPPFSLIEGPAQVFIADSPDV